MKLRAFSCLFVLLVCGASRGAETLSVVPDSAQALGTVGGRFANLHDASSVRVSPANMLEITQPELLINLAAWNGDIRFDSTNGSSVKMSQSWVYPGSLYYVNPVVPGKVAVGFGISTPFGMASTYPKDIPANLRYVVPYESRLLAVDFTPAVAFRLAKNLSVAVGMDIIYSELTLGQNAFWGPGLPDGELEVKGTGWGVGGYLGINWEFAKGHRLAFVGRLPVKIEYSGDSKISNIPAALAPFFEQRTSFDSNLNYPGSIALGYGVDITDRLTLGFDFQWSDNSSQNDLPLNIGANQALLAGQNAAVFEWQDSIDLGAGATYEFNETWLMRGGYLFSENSQTEAYYTPSVCVNDRHVFSLGVGWRGKTRNVDLTYAFVYNPIRTIGSAVQPAFNGNYKHQWHVLSLSFTQKF